MHKSLKILTLMALIGVLAAPAASAEDAQEFRRLTLNDGRELLGIVLGSTAEGMQVRLPQGVVQVGYGSLSDIGVIDAPAYLQQPAASIAVAPVSPLDESVRGLAGSVDGWLGRAVHAVPRAQVSDAKAWAAALGDRGPQLAACRGDTACLTELAADVDADYLLVPVLKPGSPPRLAFLGFVRKTSTQLASGDAVLVPTPTGLEVDARASSRAVIEGAFAALGIQPEIDVAAAANAAFPAPLAPPVAAAPAQPEPKAGPEANPRPEEKPEVVVTTTPRAPTSRSAPSRATSIGLGFLPVPGLASAYILDVPGFVVSLVGTVGASWASIYGIGWGASTPEAFWAPSILVPYAINVIFNQVATAVGWKRLHARPNARAVPAALRWSPAVAPLVDGQGRAGVGAFVLGSF